MDNLNKSDLEKNSHYLEGKWVGSGMAKFIENTVYKNLETAIGVKREFGEQLKNQLGYTIENWEYAQNVGIVHALEEAYLKEQEDVGE